MRMSDIEHFVHGTACPAFAVNSSSEVIAWNQAAETVLGIAKKDALGGICCDLIKGKDECGPVCSRDCILIRCASHQGSAPEFDLKIRVGGKDKWFGVTPVIVEAGRYEGPMVIHILRQNDVRKRLENLVRDYLVSETDLAEDQAAEVLTSTRSVVTGAGLTKREVEVLGLIALGMTSRIIGLELGISTATVNNHTQNLLRKLNCHSRIEAVHKAERAGLIHIH